MCCHSFFTAATSNVESFFLWITKESVLNKNLLKLQANESISFIQKHMPTVALLLMDVALSWIVVPILIWKIIALPLELLRKALTSTPNDIKALRYPLWNNPELTSEAVWAHITAHDAKTRGELINEYALHILVTAQHEIDPFFDQIKALEILDSLNICNICNKGVISNVIDQLKENS